MTNPTFQIPNFLGQLGEKKISSLCKLEIRPKSGRSQSGKEKKTHEKLKLEWVGGSDAACIDEEWNGIGACGPNPNCSIFHVENDAISLGFSFARVVVVFLSLISFRDLRQKREKTFSLFSSFNSFSYHLLPFQETPTPRANSIDVKLAQSFSALFTHSVVGWLLVGGIFIDFIWLKSLVRRLYLQLLYCIELIVENRKQIVGFTFS